MANLKIPKLRWLLLALLGLALWRHWAGLAPSNPPAGSLPEAPEALPSPAAPEEGPLPTPYPRPRRLRKRGTRPRAGRKPESSKAAKPKPRPTPSALPTPPRPQATPLPSPTAAAVLPGPRPQPTFKPQQASSVLENVAFKGEEEVLSNLGEPDEKFDHEDRISWYYVTPALSRQGKPVCPEVQFFEGQARVVIMWPPDKMKEMIATARRLKAQGSSDPKGPQTFTFMDSFQYLGVGTRQDTVLEDLGDPDAKAEVDGKEEWDYDTLIVENGSSKRLAVLFKDKKVVEVQGR
jgi:hypothetical protein